jgi:hypothetical protein
MKRSTSARHLSSRATSLRAAVCAMRPRSPLPLPVPSTPLRRRRSGLSSSPRLEDHLVTVTELLLFFPVESSRALGVRPLDRHLDPDE